MNEGIAKALRRRERTQGRQTTAPGRGTVIPGKEAKALWASLNHRQRGEWRSKLPARRSPGIRANEALIRAEMLKIGGVTGARLLCTGRTSYNDVPPHSVETTVPGGDS